MEAQAQARSAANKGQFRRDLKDSDALHWGEGVVSVGARSIGLAGELAPGPDYKLYLSPQFVETEAEFMQLKASMVRVGDVKTFRNFLLEVPEEIDVQQYNTVVIWCESFSQFITAAKYKEPLARWFCAAAGGEQRLTLRSRGSTTACCRRPAGGMRYIAPSRAAVACRGGPLSPNVSSRRQVPCTAVAIEINHVRQLPPRHTDGPSLVVLRHRAPAGAADAAGNLAAGVGAVHSTA